jgi:hypothetical protein
MEHLAQGYPINDAAPNSKTNNATRELLPAGIGFQRPVLAYVPRPHEGQFDPSRREPNAFAALRIRIGTNRSSTASKTGSTV